MPRSLLLLAIGVFVLVAPNLVWLATSTVRIVNRSDTAIEPIGYVACDRPHQIGRLRPGASVFRLLESCGDDTLDILVEGTPYCQIYVEGELYHVDAVIEGADSVRCVYADPLSSLLVAKALR